MAALTWAATISPGGTSLDRISSTRISRGDSDWRRSDRCGRSRGQLLGVSHQCMQLYSTASYQAGDLTGIRLYSWTGQALSGWDFAGQNLTDATLSIGGYATGSNLFSANLSGANLTNARFGGADLKNADFTGEARMHGTYLGFAAIDAADFRGAILPVLTLAD